MAQPTSTTVRKDAHPFERAALESLLIRRFFYAPAFEIYGGQSKSSPVQSSLPPPPGFTRGENPSFARSLAHTASAPS